MANTTTELITTSDRLHPSRTTARRTVPIGAVLGAVLVVLLAALAGPAEATGSSHHRFPAEIDLPEGFFPEGIAIGRGNTFYVGSLADGSIYRGDLRTGEGEVLTEPTGPFTTVGIDVDRYGRVWAAGGPGGTARVYDGRSGDLLMTFQLAAPFTSFINDVIVTRHAAWFTDSGTQNSPDPAMNQFAGSPRLFEVPLGRRGRLPAAEAVQELAVDIPDEEFPNLNGIETTPDGRGLIVAHSSLGGLYTVDPRSGSAREVEIDASFATPDGIARRGRTLYVVEAGAVRIARIRLDRRGMAGQVRSIIPVPDAETPTTVAIHRRGLYAVDARFLSMTGPYEVVRLPRR